MKKINDVEPWEVVSKKVYWDRAVSLQMWQKMVSTGHRSYLPDAVTLMDVAEFVHFYGTKRFVQDWPTIRATLAESVKKHAGTYDLMRSQLTGGGWNLRPFADFYAMPNKRRQFLMQVARTPGRSIYEVAKSLNMQYRRAHEHVKNLVLAGKIRGQDVVQGAA